MTTTMDAAERAQIVPPAQHQTSLAPEEILHSGNSGMIVERVGQVRAEFRSEARIFARELSEHINSKQVGVATVLVYEETFGVKDRLHFYIHVKSMADYYTMVRMTDEDRRYRETIARDRVDAAKGGGAWDRLFVDGSLQETVLLPQFWGMYGTRTDTGAETQSAVFQGAAQLPPARAQTTQADEDVLHTGNAGIVMHRSAQVRYDFRSEARGFGREVAESINNNMGGDATVFVYEEAFGPADRLHWLIHLKDLTTYQRLLELHVRDAEVRDIYFRDRIPAEKGGGTWARMFVDGTMGDVALTPQHWGLYATARPGDAAGG